MKALRYLTFLSHPFGAGPLVVASRLAMLCLVAIAISLAAPAMAAAQDEEPPPPECTLGVYLLNVSDFDTGGSRFGADFWIWSLCPDSTRNPLPGLEFTNADELEISNEYSSETDQGQLSGAKVSGVFRYDWDLRNFPFDKQKLTIRLEEAQFDTSTFTFVPDSANSGIAADAITSGWQANALDLNGTSTLYETNFGDPSMPSDSSSEYSRVDVGIDIDRTEFGSFLQMTAIVYASVLFFCLAYVLSIDVPDSIEGQIGICSAALFAIAVNLLSANGSLGSQNGLTLIDKIHVTALIFLAFTAVVCLGSRLAFDRGTEKPRIIRWNMVALAFTLVGFIVANLVLVSRAAAAG